MALKYRTPDAVKFNFLNIHYTKTKMQHSIITSIFNVKFENST